MKGEKRREREKQTWCYNTKGGRGETSASNPRGKRRWVRRGGEKAEVPSKPHNATLKALTRCMYGVRTLGYGG